MLETMVNVYPSKEVTVKLNISQEIHFPGGVIVNMKPIMNGDGNHGTKLVVLTPHKGAMGLRRMNRCEHIQFGNRYYGIRRDEMEVRDAWHWTFSDGNPTNRELIQIQFHVEAGHNYGVLEFHHVKSLI